MDPSNDILTNDDRGNNKVSYSTNTNTFSVNNKNIYILYITFAIIIGLLLLWIIIVVFTKENSIKILNDMTNLTDQIKPVNDASII